MRMGRAWKIPVTDEQQRALEALARSKDRGESERARIILWTNDGKTSDQIAALLGRNASRIRHTRTDFRRGGVDALRTHPPPGRPPKLAEAAQPVIEAALARSPAQRPRSIARLRVEVERGTGQRISDSWVRKLVKRGAITRVGRGTPPRTSKIRPQSPSRG